MGKTRRVNVYRKKTKRLYGGNRYGQDTELLMLKLQNIRNNELILDSFSAAGLRITHLPPLPDSLEKLSVHSSFLTSLPDPLPSNLRHLEMIGTPITGLPPLPNTIRELSLIRTKITTLPVLPATLRSLEIFGTPITSLPALPDTLQSLGLNETPIISVPDPLPPNLLSLSMSGKGITSVPALPPSLEELNFSSTQITSLPELPPNLIRLNVSKTPITSLPALPPKLRVLIVSDTPITSLPAFPPSLEMLDAIRCSQLTSLPDLPPNLRHLNIFYTSLPQRRFRETNAEYNARMRARNLSAAEQTILKDGSTAPPGSALQRAMDSNILKSNIVPMLTGKSGEESNVQPGVPTVSLPTPMQQMKKDATGRYGGRTKKKKYII